jgi:hypothetical protein
MSPTRRKTSGCDEGNGFPGGIKPLKRRREALRVSRESAGAERRRVTFGRSPGRRKALKGEAYERWELKEAPEGARAQIRREGSQTLWVEPPDTRATVSGRLIERWGEKRGDRIREMLKSEKASARRFLKKGFLRGLLE